MTIFLQARQSFLKNLGGQALVWYFGDMSRAIFRGWGNFLSFNLNYFSLPLLFKTFFSPWRRYRYSYGRTFEIWKNIEVFVFNTMSRVIGAILRIGLITLGLVIEVLIVLIGFIIFSGWLVGPFFLILGLFFGLKLIFI